jgi:hypothetical protein
VLQTYSDKCQESKIQQGEQNKFQHQVQYHHTQKRQASRTVVSSKNSAMLNHSMPAYKLPEQQSI